MKGSLDGTETGSITVEMLILLDEFISNLGKDFKYIKMVQKCRTISNSKHPLKLRLVLS